MSHAKGLETEGDVIDSSVVIPFLNGGHFIGDALRSVAAQTLPPRQVIVVDDGSNDEHRRRLDVEISASGLSVDLVRIQHAGLVAARNVGIERATTDLVAFLDQDDAWTPTKQEDQAALLEKTPECGFVYSRLEICDDRLRPTGTLWPDSGHSGRIWHSLVEIGNFIPNSTCQVRRSFLWHGLRFRRQATGCEDYDLYLRLSRRCPAAFCDSVHLFHRVHSAQQSRRRVQSARSMYFIVRELLKEAAGSHESGAVAPVVTAAKRAQLNYLRALCIERRYRRALVIARGAEQISPVPHWRVLLQLFKGLFRFQWSH